MVSICCRCIRAEKLLTVYINEPELEAIGLIRMALSEAKMDARMRAINNVKHEVVADRLDSLAGKNDANWASDLNNAEFTQWMIRTGAERRKASLEVSEVLKRYEQENQRRLNVAEHIGKLIWLSILEKKFEGVQTKIGILEQVRDDAKIHSVRGAKDVDTLRKTWAIYRGVVQLGMALDFCEENPNQQMNVLHLAERYRLGLSENLPKSTSKPYVDPDEKISFVYLSKTSGPRFQNLGLSFEVN